jgi:Cytochrome C and Quinol oxidase polypeptide I
MSRRKWEQLRPNQLTGRKNAAVKPSRFAYRVLGSSNGGACAIVVHHQGRDHLRHRCNGCEQVGIWSSKCNGKEADTAIDIGAGTGAAFCRDMSTALLAVLYDAGVEVIHSFAGASCNGLGIGLYACRTAAIAAAQSSHAPNSDLNTLSATRHSERTGRPVYSTAFLFFCGFIVVFVIGAVSGFMTGAVPVDWELTDSYFVVGHIHYVLIGWNLFAVTGAIYFWLPKMTAGCWMSGSGVGTFGRCSSVSISAFSRCTFRGSWECRAASIPIRTRWDVTFKTGAVAGNNPWDSPRLE